MGRTRRATLFSLVAPVLMLARGQQPYGQQPDHQLPLPDIDQDRKLPSGKSQKDAIAQEKHKQALKEAGRLITLAQELKDELQKAGDYVVPVSAVKKTEQIENLARRIRGRLKG